MVQSDVRYLIGYFDLHRNLWKQWN